MNDSTSITDVPTDASLELALVGNCTISALVNPVGSVVWCCMPRFDSTPVFDALLNSGDGLPRDGAMTVELEGLVRTDQSYDPGTAIVRTRLWDDRGQGVELVDFAPRFITRDRVFRPAQLVRRIRPLSGHPRVRITVRPHGDWGATRPTVTRGSHHLRFEMPDHTLRLNTSVPLTYLIDGTWISLHGPMSLLLGPDETLAGGIDDTAREFEEMTALYWRHWTRRLAVPLEWQEAVIRAAITLKLCQYEETGAIVAAMTTSIPEAPDSGRNWDYRYCWLRDAFFVVRALNSLSEVGTMESYLNWLYNIVRGAEVGHVQPLYGIGLERELPESIITQAAGYRGMGPVRVGNQAQEHFQHDVYGSIVLGAAQAFLDHRLFRRGDMADFAALEVMGEQAWSVHDKPDAGIWELRTRARVHTSSTLMCWAACDRLGRIARVMGATDRANFWLGRAAIIRDLILDQAWNTKRMAFVESLGGHELDASVLLMGEVGFLSPKDPRFISTVQALEASLCDGPFMRRYEAEDDFGRPETAFNVCSFWRVDALARIGRTDDAREAFEALLAKRNSVGLLSEDLAPATGELWGNFPQTYSMVGIINGAVRLSAPWDIAV
ncbi:MAG: glycoside hydrolase family 15 protein [Burkholderiales bacterium]|nr:glycoside hydrolase family 15 protein [Burkholderiales bacterium]